jgi:nucleoid-associated protein YgaU
MATADDHMAGKAGNAMLCKASDQHDYVRFDYNPAAISISHTARMQPSDAKGSKQEHGGGEPHAALSSVDEMAKANGVTSITVRSVTFDGLLVVRNCLQLLAWSYMKEVSDTDGTQKTDQYPLKFIWGDNQIYFVNLNQVTINYTRFSKGGRPVRAVVDLTLHGIPKDLPPTNPSSGGLPGRRTHLLTGAETLPELATRTYGRPDRWRQIAAANGIEDPLRVKPGTYVYLPSAQEGVR